MRCPKCKSGKSKRAGYRRTVRYGQEQAYQCLSCYHIYVPRGKKGGGD